MQAMAGAPTRTTSCVFARISSSSPRGVHRAAAVNARRATGCFGASPLREGRAVGAARRACVVNGKQRGVETGVRLGARGSTRGEFVRRLGAINGSVDDTDPETAMEMAVDAGQEKVGDMKEVALWVGAATLFGLGIGATMGSEPSEEYFAGYLLEQSLSVDNLFVFVLVFDYFQVPLKSQQRVLTYGIAGAMAMRAAMIVAGYEAVTNFKPILLVFAGVLIFSSYKLLTEDEDEEEDMADNAIVKFCSGILPVSEGYDGDKFFTVVDGVKMATPLLLCLMVIELSDVVFAVDSIPAVFGVTQDPFIVYSSNIFAILGLRSLYAFVATIVAELEYLQTAVAAVLGFVGLKMVADFGGYHVSTSASLAVVVGMLGAGVTLSLVKGKEDEK